MRVYHLCPVSLDRYGQHLERGFSSLDSSHALSRDVSTVCTATLAQLHAADHETPVCCPRNFVGPTVVLVHRPEEFFLRCRSFEEREQFLGGAKAVVLLGDCMLQTYRETFPNLLVRSIPHGFFDVSSKISVESDVRVVGSLTTWSAMRQPLDALQLLRALPKREKIVGLIAGQMEQNTVQLLKNAANDVLFVNTEDLLLVLNDEQKLRERLWQMQSANPGVVALCIPNPDATLSRALSACVDLNVQLYREHWAPRDGFPKVEYSGTAHMSGSCVLVAFDSPSMRDLRDGEGLQMVLVDGPCLPRAYFDDAQNYIQKPDAVAAWSEAAHRVATVLEEEGKLESMLRNNEQVARKLPMSEIARRYVELFEEIMKSK